MKRKLLEEEKEEFHSDTSYTSDEEEIGEGEMAIDAAEELISHAMPLLYTAILAHNIPAASGILEPLDEALEALGEMFLEY